MNVLEKILEEMENESKLAHEEMRRCARGNSLQFDEVKGYARAMEYVVDTIRSHMDEKEKVSSAEIISRNIDGKPYYEIKFQKVGEDSYTVGYGSYKLDCVVDWLNEYFEFCSETKVSVSDGKDTNVNSSWIPVSERLPEEDDRYRSRKIIDVLVTTANGRVTKVQRQLNNDYWHWGRIYCEQTAWQPLPEPYKAKEKS